MNTQQIKMFAIEQAIKLVSTQSIENKTKAVFDLADDLVRYIVEVKNKTDDFDELEPIRFDDHVQKYCNK